jgi:hypothetical protein
VSMVDGPICAVMLANASQFEIIRTSNKRVAIALSWLFFNHG